MVSFQLAIVSTPPEIQSSFCQMEGHVTQLRVRGEGRAVLVEPAPFKDGHASQVSLIGATIGGRVDNPRLLHPEQMEPLGINSKGKPFDVIYTAGKPFQIDVAAGGDVGGYRGPLPDGSACPPEWCRVVWRGTAKHIELTRDDDSAFSIASRLPFGVDPGEGERPASSLEVVEMHGFSGELRCGDQVEHLEGAYRWIAGETHTLRIMGLDRKAGDEIWATGGKIAVHVENDRRPESLNPLLWRPFVLGALLFIGVVALAIAKARSRRRRSPAVSAPNIESSAPSSKTAVRVFISSAPEDTEYRRRLEKVLTPLVRAGRIQILGTGDDAAKIAETSNQERLRSADLIILLISSDFMSSERCHEVELKIALEQHASHDVRVVPVVLRPVDLVGTALAQMQCLPRATGTDAQGQKGISSFDSEDLAYHEVAVAIREILEDMQRDSGTADVQSSNL